MKHVPDQKLIVADAIKLELELMAEQTRIPGVLRQADAALRALGAAPDLAVDIAQPVFDSFIVERIVEIDPMFLGVNIFNGPNQECRIIVDIPKALRICRAAFDNISDCRYACINTIERGIVFHSNMSLDWFRRNPKEAAAEGSRILHAGLIALGAAVQPRFIQSKTVKFTRKEHAR